MDIKHDVTEADRQPENAEEALRKRQLAEDEETRRVRGPQRPADQPADQSTKTEAAHQSSPVGTSAPSRGHRRRDLAAEPKSAPASASPNTNEPPETV